MSHFCHGSSHSAIFPPCSPNLLCHGGPFATCIQSATSFSSSCRREAVSKPPCSEFKTACSIPHTSCGVDRGGVWCLVSAVPGTDSTGRTGYGCPGRAGLDGATPRRAQRLSRRSRLPRVLPPPPPRRPPRQFCMGTRPMPSVLPKVINSAWAHAQCPQFCQK